MTDAANFLDQLAGTPGAPHTFQIIPTSGPGARVLEGTLADLNGELQRLNNTNRGIFACVNETDGQGRFASNITRVRSLFVDLDGAPLAPILAAPLEPHMIVESSPDRWHAYYLVTDCTLEEFSSLQRRLAAKFNGDPLVNDLSRVMRVPGFLHVKLNKQTGELTEPFLTRIERQSTHPAYTVAEVVEGLQLPIQQSEAASVAGRPHFSPDQPYPEGQRNSALTRHAGQLIGQGLPDTEALDTLLDWNRAFCRPPLPEAEVKSTYWSIKRTDARKKVTGGGIPAKITALNKEYAVVSMGGKTVVLRESPERVEFMGVNDFKNFVATEHLDGQPVGAAWIKHPLRRTYNRVVFDPSCRAANDKVFNLWSGLNVEPREGDCSLFLSHIRDNICAGDMACFEYVLNWMAHLVQRPGDLPEVAIVLKGRQGTGKGIFVSNFGALLGRHYRHVTSRDHLLGKFNAHLQDAVLVFADEVIWGGNKEQEGVLKTLITERRRHYEQKYQGVVELDNYTRVIMATNNDWAVPAGLEERRFFVLQVGDAKMQNTNYFAAIQKEMDNGGREALLHELLGRDLTGVQIRKFPRTSALAEQQELSLDSVGRWWLDVLVEGAIGPCDSSGTLEPVGAFNPRGYKAWPTFAAKGLMHVYYIEHARRLGERFPCSLAVFGKKLKTLVELQDARPTLGGRRVPVYLLPGLVDARQQFDRCLGHERDWGDVDAEAQAH